MKQAPPLAPGARIEVRDAEWLVRRVDRTDTGGQAVHVVGLSELVRDREVTLLTDAERDITVLDPAETKLIVDTSPAFSKGTLYLESLLRKTPPTDNRLYVGHRAAMDVLPYQLEPAALALEQPRQRILIADAVGLGKTISCGILLSELIRRGRGKRILVVAIKSLLTQFQKEMWTRFSIPLTRLDSVGIQRVRNKIPSNHNPFHYFDKSIISMDTLKQDNEYRVHLENANWDIIVIDEAHNVAERGDNASQRAKLAKLLSARSDTLVLLSATPHDGRARSFASLMNMLDPTAIANPDHYGPEDIRGLFIRRFKKDVINQVKNSFKEREIRKLTATATPEEEAAFNLLSGISFNKLDQHRGGGQLFKTTLEKSLFSSPAACLKTIKNRIQRLESSDVSDHPDIPLLEDLADAMAEIKPQSFSKFQKLVETLTDKKSPLHWKGNDKTDRLVIFTERVETLEFLKHHLPGAIGLHENQVETLVGTMGDQDQQRVVEEFGKDESKVRLLIASDVAAEGINLHYLSHRMIHFDIPWSLMIFQQRNGRIDRYGQEYTPQITYLLTESENQKIRGDMRILELLIAKDDEAQKNIGDPSVFFGVYDEKLEEAMTASAIEEGKNADQFEAEMNARLKDDPEESLLAEGFDPLALLFGVSEERDEKTDRVSTTSMPSLFKDDYDYAKTALDYIGATYGHSRLSVTVDKDDRIISFTAPEDLVYRFNTLPREIFPENNQFHLTDKANLLQKEIARSRKEEHAWPYLHYLWELNPVLEWMADKVVSGFRRQEAPLIPMDSGIEKGESIYLVSGLIPNRKGQPLIHSWFGVHVRQSESLLDEGLKFIGYKSLEDILDQTGLGRKQIANPGIAVDTHLLQKHLPQVIKRVKERMKEDRAEFVKRMEPKLNDHLNRLAGLKEKHKAQIQLGLPGFESTEKKDVRAREVDKIFNDYEQWIEDTMKTEDSPYIQVVAVFTSRKEFSDVA